MKEDKFYNPYTGKEEHEIIIEKDDIEQAISWFDRLPLNKITLNDERVYKNLRKVATQLRSL